MNRYRHFWAAWLLAMLWLLPIGCQPQTDAACDGCPADETCNEETDRCEPTGLPVFEGPTPARALSVVSRSSGRWMAAIAPSARRLVAGPFVAGEARLQSIANVPASSAASLATALSRSRARSPNAAASPEADTEDVFAIAWLTPRGAYRLALRTNGSWYRSTSIVPSNEPSYTGSADFALTMDSDGRLHLVFRDPEEGGLFALSEPLPTETEAFPADELVSTANWRLELIDDGQGALESCQDSNVSDTSALGNNPDLLSANNQLHVTYHDPECGDLRYAYRPTTGDSTWQIELADTGSADTDAPNQTGLGQFSDLALSPAGELAVAYSDQTRGRLLYAVRRGDVFEPTVVDSGSRLGAFSQKRKHLVGAYTSLAYTPEGSPLIAYLDATDNTARIAVRVSGQNGWTHRSTDLGRPNGFYNVVTRADGEWQLFTERKHPTQSGLDSRLVISPMEWVR